MRVKGKAYANKKAKIDRPKNDNYDTPYSLVWELLKRESFSNVLEPAEGRGAIVKALGNCVTKSSGIETDFFKYEEWSGDIVTNPPFYLWDRFVEHAKEITPNTSKICLLGRVNYFGTHSRAISKVWWGLKKIYIFDRMVDYRTPYRDDGLFHVGAMVTGWFIWDKNYTDNPTIEIMDVNKYAKLGAFKEGVGVI